MEKILRGKYCSWIPNVDKYQIDAPNGVSNRVYQQFCYYRMRSLPSDLQVFLVYF